MMRVTIYQGEKTVTDLVTRLFQVPQASRLSRLLSLSSGETQALVQKAEAALRQANPALSDLEHLPPGTVLVIPTVEGLQPTADVVRLNAAERARLKALGQNLQDAWHALDANLRKQVEQARAAVQALASDAVTPLLRFPQFKANLEAMRQDAKASLAAAEQLLAIQGTVGNQLVKDIVDLEKTAS
jgi:hypothetical protein